MRIKAALWQRQQEARLIMMASWNGAGWLASRMSGKQPKRPDILSETLAERAPQTPEEVQESILLWARAAGLTVERHEYPVI